MFSCRELMLALMLLAAGAAVAQPDRFPGIGRAATAKEIAAWDIDVRPDFKGLPAGAGSVATGMQVWESKCASCHGVFGESNAFFSPIVGGTTQDDIKTGRVARLTDPSFPGRTTLMKLSTVSTLWDYINRAMPWTQPKSLSTEEVYAVTAYILNLGGVVPDSFVLSDQNIAEVQQRLPNRNGMSTDHALWPGAVQRQPGVRPAACMKDCAKEAKLASFLPDFARDAHGNLAEQNRAVGAQKGADTRRPGAVAAAPAEAAPAAIALVQKHACVACHGMESKTVGPGFRDVSRKYAGTADALPYLTAKIKAGGSGVWGAVAMPSQPLGEADAQVIAQWLVQGMKP
jgi:S-disulfanyl-L-cysteine oxidoreductase SoxD